MKFGSIQETAGQVAGGGALEEASVAEDVLDVEVGGDRLAVEAVLGVDHPEHRHVVVRVPAPGDLGRVEVAAERLQVVRPGGRIASILPPELPATA